MAGAAMLVLGLGFLYFVRLFARPLGLFILGIAIATSLAPVVKWLSRWLPRTLAVVCLYVVLLAIVTAIGWLLLPGFVNQVQNFTDQLPQFIIQAQEWLDQYVPLSDSSVAGTRNSWLSDLGSRVITLPFTLVNSILSTFLVLFLSMYSLIVAPRVLDFLLSLVPERRHADVRRVTGEMVTAMGGYVRGVFISGLVVAVATYVGLLLLGVEYPLLLALMAGSLEVVPVLGTLISSTIIVGVALLQSFHLALLTLVFVVVLQLFEGNVLFPNVMSSQTDISPLLGLLAFFAGSVVGGILGALVAIPLAAALRVLAVETVAPMVRRWTGAAQLNNAERSST